MLNAQDMPLDAFWRFVVWLYHGGGLRASMVPFWRRGGMPSGGVGRMWCHFGTRRIANSCTGGVKLWEVRQGETGPDRWRDKIVPFAVQSCPKLLPKNLRKILSVGLAMPIDNVRMIQDVATSRE